DEEPSLSVSADAFRYGRLTVRDALGSNQDIDADLFDFIPLLVAGLHRFQGAKDWLFGFSIVTRQQYSANFRDQVNTQADLLRGPLFPGNEFFLGQFDDSRQVNEVWAIAAVSRQIRQDLSVGIAPVLDFRRHFIRQRFSATTVSPQSLFIPSAPFPVTTSGLFDTTFFQFSLLFRLGIAWEPSEKFRLGATVTTPNIKLYGKGEALSETTCLNCA